MRFEHRPFLALARVLVLILLALPVVSAPHAAGAQAVPRETFQGVTDADLELFRQKLADAQQVQRSLEKCVAAIEQRDDHLSQESHDRQAELGSLQGKADVVMQQIQQAQTMLLLQEARLASLLQQRQKQAAQSDHIGQRISALNAEIEQCRWQLGLLLSWACDLAAEIIPLQSTIRSLSSERIALDVQVRRVQDELDEVRRSKIETDGQLSTLQQGREELTASIETTANEISRVKAALTELRNVVQENQLALQEIANEMQTAQGVDPNDFGRRNVKRMSQRAEQLDDIMARTRQTLEHGRKTLGPNPDACTPS